MEMDTITKILFATGGTVFAMLIAIVAYFLKELIKEVKGVRQEITDIKLELAKDYVRREEMAANDSAHKDLRLDLVGLRDRITTLEAEHHAQVCK